MTKALPPLRDVIDRYDLGAKKSLGQHFLLDLNITRKIARAGDVTESDTVLEIGPGPGGLTRALLETGANVIAVERDARCVEALGELIAAYPGKFQIIEDDALSLDYTSLSSSGPVKIIANLPYNISTELLTGWLKQGTDLWSVMVLMFQKEVGDRILASPGSKTYGRLSVISQAASAPARAFDLPARAFTPPPKIDSSVVRFDAPRKAVKNIAALERLTQAAFSQRRKMLRSSLKSLLGDALPDTLAATGIKETQRAEEISVEQYIELAAQSA